MHPLSLLTVFTLLACPAVLAQSQSTGDVIDLAKRSAHPEPHVTIPLTKRNFDESRHWKRRNGAVYIPVLRQEVAKTALKYSKVSSGIGHALGRKVAYCRTISVLMLSLRTVWSGQITVGNQSFSMYFDSGSTDLTLPMVGCADSDCGSKKLYDPSASTTAVNQNKTIQSRFADGSFSKGSWFKDLVTAGGMTSNQSIIGATQLSSTIKGLESDGIMGLAYPALSSTGTPSFPFTLNGKGRSGVFAIRLSDSEAKSEISFGGMNQAQLGGKVAYFSAANSPGQSSKTYWQIGDSAAMLDGKVALSKRVNHIIDSGTTFIIAPISSATEFYSKISGSQKLDDSHWTYPCASPPTVGFSYRRSQPFLVNADDFNLGYLPDDPSRCVGAIIGQDLGLGTSWVLGSTFLKSFGADFWFGPVIRFSRLAQNWYTIFDVAQARIGFATPKA
ncbi:BQ2448_1489 [Microbotryum intermedium]|uniref:BQ2448_1489 protein n=1 Tax=Microbotryum intermedium TaxID=269621 RepID=A0A238FA60_9BASI|nr:BQ2448_1489 [Microbotryum intermedium]